MSKNANTNMALYKRLIIFIAGLPGYLLTFVPWVFVITIIFELSISYSNDGTFSLPSGNVQFEQLDIGFIQIVFWLLLSSGLWIFIAWFVKRLLLHISRLFGESEKTWQVTKITALVGGWLAVIVIAQVVFDNIRPGFLLSELIVISIGLMSLGLEYLLSKTWHIS